MCYFAYLAVEIRDDMRAGDVHADVARVVAASTGVVLDAIAPTKRSTLAAFSKGADALFVFRVGHCACDWGEAEHARTREVVRVVLAARDVRRVRVGRWMIGADVASADPGRGTAAPELHEIDSIELDGVEWSRGVQLVVRRAPVPPFPTQTLARLAR
ncbi:hypothetical protein [Sandaracinus amylolyticus]|uniref:Uncharacterized protein n=1 Tax=Sandaracinus amylolyticus TaxID=927083 RepID=A0A0F6SG72_9BACT|nr:hypothetical protein [Sandaracinus amylolyticus]AKF08189.1 hypothetical protein DB32_005338 [Sandaracinus amylolyticus]